MKTNRRPLEFLTGSWCFSLPVVLPILLIALFQNAALALRYRVINPARRRAGPAVLATVLAVGLIGLAACTPPVPSAPTAVATTAFRFGDPLVTREQALAAVRSALEGAYDFTGKPVLVSLEETTFGDAEKLLGVNDGVIPQKVWLAFLYDDAWSLTWFANGTTAVPSFRGCVSVIVNADDGTPMAIGGPVSPGIRAGCDVH